MPSKRLNDLVINTCKALHSHRSLDGWCSVKLNAFIQAEASQIDNEKIRNQFLKECNQYLNQLLGRK